LCGKGPANQLIQVTDAIFFLLSNILISVIEIPSYIFLVLAMDIWGRYSGLSTSISL
jgi:hypothetical protein